MAVTREAFRPYTDPETFERIVEYPTVAEMWRECLKTFAERPAIEDDGKTYTFAQLEKDASAVRRLFRPVHGRSGRQYLRFLRKESDPSGSAGRRGDRLRYFGGQ